MKRRFIAFTFVLVMLGMSTKPFEIYPTSRQQRRADPKAVEMRSVARLIERGTVPQYSSAANTHGRWIWDPANTNGVLVVVGTYSPDPAPELLRHGYLVWKPNFGCRSNPLSDTCEFDLQAQRRAGRVTRVFGYHLAAYVTYLGDTSPSRPTAQYVAFVSNSSDDLIAKLQAATEVAKATGRLESLHQAGLIINAPRIFRNVVHTVFPNLAINELRTLKRGADFVVPAKLIDNNNQEEYKRLVDLPHPRARRGLQLDNFDLLGSILQLCMRGHVDEVAPMSKPAATPRYIVKVNKMGTWTYDPLGAHLDTIVVLGGTDRDPTGHLAQEGYVVWRRNDDCRKVYHSIMDAPDLSISLACHEMWGYLGYLSDTDPAKPVGKRVALIHGHLESWHQPGRLSMIIEDAVKCSVARNGFAPLTKVRTANANRRWEEKGTALNWINYWNKHFGDIRRIEGTRLESFCCATGVFPQELIDRYTPEIYARFATPEIMVEKGGFFYEYMFPVMFNQPEVINTTARIPECTEFNYADKIGFPKPP
eukprot:TRINITY_DN174_c0_g1_i1.p1 TRINITY_DN174_c0_g1~~TRINITY_DN174_c0_g1_i1.p1  ORF type:complete len:547 (+),score=135.95 TRINITY_DN174_c0_g1_i1:38-1642(+)